MRSTNPHDPHRLPVNRVSDKVFVLPMVASGLTVFCLLVSLLIGHSWGFMATGFVFVVTLGLWFDAKRRLEFGTLRQSVDEAVLLGAAEDNEYEKVKRRLTKLRYEGTVKLPAEEALSYLKQARDRFRRCENELRSGLDPNEVTFKRYHEVLTRTYQGLLRAAWEVSECLSSYDWGKKTQSGPAPLPQSQLRLPGKPGEEKTPEARVAKLFRFQDKAFASLDRFEKAVGAIGSGKDKPDPVFDDLEELTRRAKKY